MISLKRDFIHNGKAMMTIDKTGGFVRSELSEVQLQMVMSNVISGHLPMSMKEINQEITFHYDISGKKMLSQTARHEKLSLTGLFQLLLQITQTLLTCPQYMLDEQRYVLHEDYIFTTDPLEEAKVYLCYIPASLEKEVESIAFQISQMVNRMMPYVKALEGTGIQRILQLCNDGDFQLDDLQELLNELLISEAGVGSKSSARINSVHGVSSSYPMDGYFQGESSRSLINEPGDPNLQRSSRPTPAPIPVPVPKQIPVLSNHSNDSFISSVPLNPLRRSSSESASENRPGLALGSISHPIFSMKDTYESSGYHSIEGEEKETKKPKKSEKPIYYWLGGMLLASVLWRFLYMDEPTTIRLVMCLVITVTLAAAAYLLSAGKLAGIGNMSLNSTRKQEDDYLNNELSNNELSNNEQSSSFSLFQQKEETDFPGKRGIFGGGNKNKEGAEPWRWNSPSKLEESDAELLSNPFKQVASDFNISFTAPKSLGNEEQETTDHYYNSLRHSTQMLNSSHAQATVLLSDVESVSSSAGQSAVVTIKKGILERQAPQAAPEQMELGTASFIIGRSQEVSQYVEEGKGTSRAHVEISKSKDQYYIKDLNSMNGTLLLDQPMIPYKEYVLEEGDFFVIAESKYTFRYV
ncbi:DUF6382 domain-containing protein [Paenibacillus polygoni]|uniref:DUF6382 domain-containing protein n=1 Tax=Paenibacillus polygoni TaxID=3050112 RepID=A0ABY8X549_9BACL|nr:DUF6382 domain-containing protein [Paenibacillus polygoni]WIV20173.1 DUF6382 domain-containing protein [Paenibacillus polygoni]